eukprot:1028448-Amphidinium_carterae.1
MGLLVSRRRAACCLINFRNLSGDLEKDTTLPTDIKRQCPAREDGLYVVHQEARAFERILRPPKRLPGRTVLTFLHQTVPPTTTRWSFWICSKVLLPELAGVEGERELAGESIM